MLINGSTPIQLRGTFSLVRGDTTLSIPIKAVTADWDIRRNQQLPEPRPPMTFVRDAKGLLARDEAGKVMQTEDTGDQAYRQAAATHNTLLLVAYIYAGTVETDGFAWSADKSVFVQSPRQFYQDLLAEIVDSGISQGELRAWFQAIYRLSNLTQEDVAAAAASFQRN